ncbi:hypothetical protein [Streptomyces chattanoogensis]|uniref:hypothetical protein n=1 Tax=Streptomyces chattanoogensis TaxID=66876 RepID=UPI0036CF2AEC
MNEGITRWVVYYWLPDESDLGSTVCVLEHGRNPLEDFPTMLAIQHGRSREQSDLIEVVSMRKVVKR